MKGINKFLLVTVILFMLSVTAVSASDNITDDTQDTLDVKDSSVTTHTAQISEKTDIQASTDSNKISNSEDKNIKQAPVVTVITSKNYNNFFTKDPKTNQTISSGQVMAGDVLDLQGEFKGVNFTIDKKNVTITSVGRTAKLYNCSVNVQGLNSQGSQVHNLTIHNNNPYGTGIYTNITKNLYIANNTIHVHGVFAFAIACDEMNESTIINNTIKTTQTAGVVDIGDSNYNRTHTALPMGNCYFNKIVNNTVSSDRANGIYFSAYGSGLFRGGYCDNNIIDHNYVTGGNTSWSYTIQVMGKNNIIHNNTVNQGYRGISTQDFKNNTITYNKVNATAQGIYACEGAIVKNNEVRVNFSTVGIETGGPDVVIENNRIYSNSGAGIIIGSSNVNVTNNYILSTEGYGIYAKGNHKNINIRKNNITSGKTGIYFKKQSSSKKVNYITVKNNVISSQAAYAIDFSEAGARSKDESFVTVDESNVLSSKNGKGLEKAYLAPIIGSSAELPESNKTFVITDSNYVQYFDEEGIANSKINKNDTVILKGTFNNKDFQFPQKVHLIGQNCVINTGTITLLEDADSSTVKDIRINNKKPGHINRHGLELLEVNNCNITNVNITNFDNTESFGIFLYVSSGNTITNCKINTSGNLVNNGMFIYSSDLNVIKNNNIFINQSAIPYEYYDEIMFNDKIGTIKEILHNHGIVLVYSSLNSIDRNVINTKSEFKGYTRPTEECKNSIVGIDIYFDSHENNVTYNQVYIDSYGPYAYGMGVLGAPWGQSILTHNASNNTFRKNTVKVLGGYCTEGFIAGLNSVNTLVDQNTITITPRKSNRYYADYGYGVVFESCRNLTLTNNNITAKGAATYATELYHTHYNTIENNTFKIKGTQPYGVASEASTHNTIKGNIFDITQKEYGTIVGYAHSDSIPAGDQGVFLSKKSHNNSVTANTIKTNAQWPVYIDYDSVQNNVTNNSLQGNKTFGDKAVKNESKALIQNNYLYPIKCSAKNVDGQVGGKITLVAYMSSRTKDVSNVTATFRLGGTTVGTSKITDGKATITYSIPNYWRAGNYDIIVVMGGRNFQNSTARATAAITKNATKTVITANKVLGTPGSTVQINATVKDTLGNNMNGKVDIILNGTKLATKTLTDGKITHSYKIPSNSPITTLPLVIKYLGNDQFAESNISTILGIQNQVVASVYNSNGTVGSPITFKAKFTQNGKALTSGKVAVKINGLTIGTTNIVNGIATYNYVIPVGYSVFQKHVVQFVYGGTDTLTSARAEREFDVYPMKTVIQLNKTTAKVGQNITMKVRITNESLTHNAVSGKVALKIKGVTVKDANGNPIVAVPQNGIVTIKIPITKSLIGKNTITVTYSGNNRLTGARVDFKDILVVTN